MFKKRRKDGAPMPSPPLEQQHRRGGSASATATMSNARTAPSPVQNFDFDFPTPTFASDDFRPSTSDGGAGRKSSISAEPPILPPILRVSSQREAFMDLGGVEDGGEVTDPFKSETSREADVAMPTNPRDSVAKPSPTLTPARSFSRPSPLLPVQSQDAVPSTTEAGPTFRMESSLFPTKTPAFLPPIDTDMPMSRAFIDSRDKPYGLPPARPQIPATNSSPDLRSTSRPGTASAAIPREWSTLSPPSNVRPGPQQSFSTGNMNPLIRPPSNATTTYSGTTARSNQSSKSTAVGSDAPTLTIGTPYQETSPSFPLPQHVATRPKTAGMTANIRGVDVPTHHTSSLNQRPEPPTKTEKRKTKMLNPMSLLSRKRSGLEEEAIAGVRAAQAQALQRQRTFATGGVDKLSENFDPSIRGKVVHDFSAPRQSRRMFSYNDALESWDGTQGSSRGLQSTNSAPFIPTLQGEDGKQRRFSDGSPRRSMHTPVFLEHISDGSAQNESSAAALQAERLENKAFLNRASLISQESAVLPPFARRSQQVEPIQAGFLAEEMVPTDRSPAAKRERDSHISSSSSGISPITQRGSAMPGGIDATGEGVSPVSPASSDRHGGALLSRPFSRPVSEVSRLGSADGAKTQRMSEASRLGSVEGIRPPSTVSSTSGVGERSSTDFAAARHVSAQPGIEPIAEEQTPKLGDGFMPVPERPPPIAPAASFEGRPSSKDTEVAPTDGSARASIISSPGRTSLIPTPEPEPTAALSGSQKLGQKRADAVGHAKRASSGTKPKHHVSNASRFSFQFGGSAAEELALELKARKIGVEPGADRSVGSPDGDYDEDDYFDEDAMNDMDEMEEQAQQQDSRPTFAGLAPPATASEGPVSPISPTFMPMANARRQLQLDDESDGVSEPDSDEEAPYWMHDDFKSYTHTRDPSTADGSALAHHHRKSGSGGRGLTLNTNVGPNSTGFYMHPQAAGYSSEPSQMQMPRKPPLPHRDSGNSERNRIASGMTFATDLEELNPKHESTLSKSTVGSADDTTDKSFNHSSTGASGSTDVTGLGLSGFGGFKFIDSPEASRPTSLDAKQKLYPDRRRGDSETLPHNATFGHTRLSKSALEQNALYAQKRHTHDQYGLDDMYFDDGGFDPDVDDRAHPRGMVNEDAFDDDGYLDPTNRMGRYLTSADRNSGIAMDYTNLITGDGPYPSFARPTSAKSRERDSQLLLEDLPLQEAVDPKLVPRRNPSEDAKRLGLSSRVPPLPAQGLNAEAAAKAQAAMQAYHATLAEAANKAWADGRFNVNLLRVPSAASGRSGSVYSKNEPDSKMPHSTDTRSLYSRYEDDEMASAQNGSSKVARTDSQGGAEMDLPLNTHYSPIKMNFDFGFDSSAIDDSVIDDGYSNDDYDDIVAEANAEALANDDDGFYGQEFGFYAKARPNSGELQAINGGFFGPDGDDGLSRQKSLKEPNLTPITERSEFSTRNSFIGPGMSGQFGPSSAGPFTPFTPGGARLPVSPWVENEITTFDQLRRLKASAFGGSNASLHSDGSGSSGLQMHSGNGPVSARSSAQQPQGYFGGAPMTFGYSNDSSGSSNPSSAQPQCALPIHESPQSAVSNSQLPFGVGDADLTPRRPLAAGEAPSTVRRISDRHNKGVTHSRTSSGADSVTYVREQDPDGQGPPRWVLEKRRTSEAGQLELVAREVLQTGWI